MGFQDTFVHIYELNWTGEPPDYVEMTLSPDTGFEIRALEVCAEHAIQLSRVQKLSSLWRVLDLTS